MNPIILHPAMSKIVGKTEIFYFAMVTDLSKKKKQKTKNKKPSDFESVKLCSKDIPSVTLFSCGGFRKYMY